MDSPIFNYERYFELTPDLVCIAGYDGFFKKINQAVANTLGYSFEELYARPINSFIHPDDQNITAEQRNELTKSNSLHNFENRYLTKKGKIIWLAWTSFPSVEDQIVFAIAKDITHKKRLETERNEQLAQLSHRNNTFKQINYRTAHDLRAPINNMKALLNLIDLADIEDEKNLKLIKHLKKGSDDLKERMNFYIDAISENTGPSVEIEKVKITDCLETVLDSINNLVSTSNFEIKTDFSKQAYLQFNRNYLESILLNLITNSIKYAKVGTQPVVKIASRDYPTKTELIFEDNGMGFDMEKVKDKIFGLHQTFHHNSDSKGVGLYLVHTHITSLGGSILVESELNMGTTFTLTFIK